MAQIDLLRQLGNFNWGHGWCNNIVTKWNIVIKFCIHIDIDKI